MKRIILVKQSILLLLPATLLVLSTAASAQDANPAGVRIEVAPQPAQAEAPEVAPEPEPVAVESGLTEAVRTMSYDRTPEALLEVVGSRQKEGEDTEVGDFHMAVLIGDWATVGRMLASLPAKDAAVGYSRLLSAVAGSSRSIDEVLKVAPNQGNSLVRSGSTASTPKPEPAPLLSEDFYALIDAAPGDLREDDLPAVSGLIKTAIGVGGKMTLLNRLETGWKGLGGKSPEGRLLATQLLSSLGWISDAAPFLPLKEEDWADADTLQLVFTMEYFTQTGIAHRDERLLQRAAEVCAHVMKKSRFGNYTRPQFRLALDRLVQLLPALNADDAKRLIREQLFKQTATLSDLISIIGELGQKAAIGKDMQERAASLGTQQLLLEALVDMEGELPAVVVVPVMNWLSEAEACYRSGGVATVEMTQAETMMMMRYGRQPKNTETSLPTQTILTTAPPRQILQRLNPGLVQRVDFTLLKVNILEPKEENIGLLRSYLEAHPGLEREVCEDVLSSWVRNRSKPAESEQVKWMRASGYPIPPQMQQGGSGIPLTRLRQNQNIQQFKTLLIQLRELSPDPIDASLVVQSFMTLHSGAEVYRPEDIEAIFGPPEKMVRAELLELLAGMRSRLSEQWRDPEGQQQAGTNRTEEEAKDEVSRGYRTALELVKRGIKAEDGDWAAFITRGQLFYDVSQYEFDRQVQLSEYVSLRDEAFASFRKAAEIYASKLPSMPRGQWTIEPYQAWFMVMLGASDLSQLTTSTARSDPGLTSIGDAMRSLPGEAPERHLEMFGKMLGDLFPRVTANVRQRFLSSGLKVIGEEHPAAKAAAASLDYYRELLDEVQLRVTVDGPTRVGNTQPFGVFIGIEATRQLLRESGGFGKYIRNQSQQQGMMGAAPSQGARNLRDDFVANIHAALDETFEVISLTFHDATVKTIDLPREGWVETPLLYAVLRAKSAAVDRIPSIQIDMDFVDQPGQVVLPVMSQLQPLDAKDDTVEPRPCADLELTLTMDEREWSEGKVVVEIQARGQGIIPSLEEMFDCEQEGFKLESVDGRMSVAEFVSDGRRKIPQADRNWQLSYTSGQDLSGDVVFHFPSLKSGIQPTSLEFKHYQDADLITMGPDRAAAGVALSSNASDKLTGIIIVGLIGLVLAGLILLMLRRRTSKMPVGEKALSIPPTLTPFTVVAFLRRIQREHSSRLGEEERTALEKQIREIESGYFSQDSNPGLDLSSVTGKWLQAVR